MRLRKSPAARKCTDVTCVSKVDRNMLHSPGMQILRFLSTSANPSLFDSCKQSYAGQPGFL
jgi:hypothetical protein